MTWKILEIFNLKHKIAILRTVETLQNKNVAKIKAELEKLNSKKNTIEENIYKKIREQKIKNNSLIVIDNIVEMGFTKNKTIFEKILDRLSKSEPISDNYKGVYFGFGQQLKIIDIPIPKNKALDLKEKGIRILNESDKHDTWFLEGKTVLWIHQNSIILPEFDTSKKNWVFEIEPVYLNNFVNNILDNKLTTPVMPAGMNFTWKTIILIGAIVGGIYYVISSAKKGEIKKELLYPLFFIAKNEVRKWKK